MRVFAIFIRQITRGVDRDQQTEKHHHKQNQRTHAINDQAKQCHIPTLTNVNVTATLSA